MFMRKALSNEYVNFDHVNVVAVIAMVGNHSFCGPHFNDHEMRTMQN